MNFKSDDRKQKKVNLNQDFSTSKDKFGQDLKPLLVNIN